MGLRFNAVVKRTGSEIEKELNNYFKGYKFRFYSHYI
jgi:hypothetical protein